MNARRKIWSCGFIEDRLDALIGGLIFVSALCVFLLSPVRQVTDSRYSMLVSQSLLEHGSFALDHYNIPRLPPIPIEHYVANGWMFQLERVNGHIYYFLPHGSSVLSVPYVAVMNAFGISAVNPDGTPSYEGETKIAISLAALLMAALASLFFFTARLVLPRSWSVLIALGGALGTQVWSTASRGMWSDTWGLLLLGIAVWLLLAQEASQRRLNPIILGSLMAWLYFVRPTNSVPIMAVTVYLFVYYRGLFIPYAATGALWLMGFIAYSWHNFGKLLPTYYGANRLEFRYFGVGLAGNLISPSRGLLIYVPIVLFVAYLLVRYRKHLAWLRLVGLSLSIIAGHLIAIAGFGHWWGGHSYGARFTTSLVPWFILLAILGIQAMLRWRTEHRAQASLLNWHAPLAAGAALLLLSVWINARGAISIETWKWNLWVEHSGLYRTRLWDWRYPQFLAGMLLPPPPENFPLIEAEQRINFPTPEAGKYLWYGWSNPEPPFRWTDAEQATVIFALKDASDIQLQMKLGPFLVPGKLYEQRVDVSLNEHLIGTMTLREEGTYVYSITLPQNALRQQNVLRFTIPTAASPESLNAGKDARTLGIKVEWMMFRPQPTDQ